MESKYNYKLIRSKRKTMSIQIVPEGLVVRAPLHAKQEEIDRFVNLNSVWIERNRKKLEERLANQPPLPEKLTMDEIRELAEKAAKVIPERVRYYAPLVGVTYGRITIRNQSTRWGSCSSKGNLNFNCLLMLTPPEVIDSVVVHELCHRKEMNHSKKFYAEVLRVFPDYYKWDKWLKENGSIILSRMRG